MKKQIIGCLAFLFACATVSINSTAHTVKANTLMYASVNDTTPPMHRDSSWNKNKMNKAKNKMHDSTHRMNDSTMQMRDSTK